jgi:hypothetical protein
MLKTIVPAQLEFKDGVLFSSCYGDIWLGLLILQRGMMGNRMRDATPGE